MILSPELESCISSFMLGSVIYSSPQVNSPVAQMVKNLPAMQETRVQSLGRGRSSGEENGNPLQHTCLENPTDRGARQATVHGVAKSQIQLSN